MTPQWVCKGGRTDGPDADRGQKKLASTMREIVHIQAGQCGNQIGAKVAGLGGGEDPGLKLFGAPGCRPHPEQAQGSPSTDLPGCFVQRSGAWTFVRGAGNLSFIFL